MNLARAIRMVADAALYNPDSNEMREAAHMVFALARDPLPVLIVMDGGIIQNVITDAPVEVVVIDYDCEGAPEEDLTEVPQEPVGMELAFVDRRDIEPMTAHWQEFLEWWESQ